MNQSGELLRVRGGATLPSATMLRSNVSWPLGRLVLTELGIQMSASLLPDTWAVTWDEIETVSAARRSMVVTPRSGRSARFVCMGHSKLVPVLEVVAGHGVRIEKVRSTARAAWRL